MRVLSRGGLELALADNATLGRRIKAHRLAAGLSLRELSQRVTVSAQALSQYEMGHTRPRPEVLGSLADALGTRIEQLERAPGTVALGSVRLLDPHRRMRRELSMAQGFLVSLTERSLALEQRLGGGFPSPSLPVMNEIRPVRDPEDAESLAEDVRRRWGLGTGPLPSVVSLFEARGVRIFEFLHGGDLPGFTACSAFVSFSNASWSDFPVVLLNGGLRSEEKRIALCRELAYMILPSPVRFVLDEDEQDQAASWFASALLLPAAALRSQLGRKRRTLSWYELKAVNREFGVGYEAIADRCRQSGIISRGAYRSLREECRRAVWNKGPGHEETGVSPKWEYSTRLRRLALRAVTEGIMAPGEAAALLDVNQKRVESWIEVPSAV